MVDNFINGRGIPHGPSRAISNDCDRSLSPLADSMVGVEAHHPGARDVVTMQIVGPDERAAELVDEAGQVLRGACHAMMAVMHRCLRRACTDWWESSGI